jgi:hypothetical protein
LAGAWGDTLMTPADKKDKLAIFLGILLFFLFSYPFLEIFNHDVLIAGIPLMPLYLFIVWLLAIIILYFLGRRLRRTR